MRSVELAKLSVFRPEENYAEGLPLPEWLENMAKRIETNRSSWNPCRDGFKAVYWGLETRRVAFVRVPACKALSDATRKRIGKWLRSRADYLRKHHAVALRHRGGWFTQSFRVS